MLFNRKIVRRIKAACREACGGRRAVEIGRRTWDSQTATDDGLNFLTWGEGNDLEETVDVDNLVGQDVGDSGGWVALDCYCYNLPAFGRDPDDALDCNVYVLLNPSGEVAYVSQNDIGHAADIDAILRAAGHPGYVYVD